MTPMHEHEARARLQGVAPGARPDVDGIIRTGRRRNRTVALGTVAAAVVVLAGVGVGAALLWQPPTRDAVPAPLQTPSSAPTTIAPQPTASSTPSAAPTRTPQAPTRSWPTIRGEAGGGLTVDGKSVRRPMGPDAQSLPFADFVALMGTPDEQITSATCREQALSNTLYRWGDLMVFVLDEEDTSNEYGFAYPPGEVAGWSISPMFDGEPGLSFPMTGPNGAKISDSVAQLDAIFPADEWDYTGVDDDIYVAFAGDTTGVAFPLDDQQKVMRMNAGYTCQVR